MTQETFVCVPFGTGFLLKVTEFIQERELDWDPVWLIKELAQREFDSIQDDDIFYSRFEYDLESLEPDRGVIWGTVFLRDGTWVRMSYKRQVYYAMVVGDQLISQQDVVRDGVKILEKGQPVSPSEFAGRVTGTSRNAWLCLYVRKPGEDEWELAGRVRSRAEAIKKETLGG